MRSMDPFGCLLKWWYHQNTPKWSFAVGKPMVVGYHHFRKPPFISQFSRNHFWDLMNSWDHLMDLQKDRRDKTWIVALKNPVPKRPLFRKEHFGIQKPSWIRSCPVTLEDVSAWSCGWIFVCQSVHYSLSYGASVTSLWFVLTDFAVFPQAIHRLKVTGVVFLFSVTTPWIGFQKLWILTAEEPPRKWPLNRNSEEENKGFQEVEVRTLLIAVNPDVFSFFWGWGMC